MNSIAIAVSLPSADLTVRLVFLVLAGSLVIMANLNENMMAHGEMMNLQRQR